MDSYGLNSHTMAVVAGAKCVDSVGATVGSGAAGASLVLVRPQRAVNGTTVGAAVVGSTGGGGGINGAGDGCTVGSAAGMVGGSVVGMISGRPVCWEKMSDS
jgi:hypothetical protein